MFKAPFQEEFAIGTHGVFFFCGNELLTINCEGGRVIEGDILCRQVALKRAGKTVSVDVIYNGHGRLYMSQIKSAAGEKDLFLSVREGIYDLE